MVLQETPFQCTIRACWPSAAGAAATPTRYSPWPGVGFGLRTCSQVVPFQCRIRVLPLSVEPTAQALRAEAAATPARMPPLGELGLGTRFQVVPFQCRIRVLSPVRPTAQALRAEAAATPARVP